MSPSTQSGNRPKALSIRSRSGRVLAGSVAAAVTVAGLSLVGGQSANAATGSAGSAPLAQSVGNYLDATLGGSTLDAIAKLQYATAQAPGSTTVQNPLNVTALSAINLPLTGALQLPQLLGISLGAVTQKAYANINGQSYGQVGTALNQGGVSVGGTSPSDMAGNATINLTAAGIAGNSPIPIPGGTGSAAALGGITATVGAVSAVAQTPVGVDKGATTAYQIANLNLNIGSPLIGGLLGNVLSTVTGALGTIVTSLTGAVGALAPLPASCSLISPSAITNPIQLEVDTFVTNPDGSHPAGITLDPKNAAIEVNLGALLDVLLQKANALNGMAPNTDLLSYLLAYLADPKGLAAGIQGIINGLTAPLVTQFNNCKSAINAIPALGPVLTTLISTLTNGQTTLESTISNLVGGLTGAAGVNPLAPIASLLENLIDIGINVQPNGPAGPSGAAYVDHLAATPKQGTPVVAGQTIVRAIEVNVAAAAGSSLPGLPSLPGLGSLPGLPGAAPAAVAAPFAAAAPNTGILTLGLANAAAGPSAAATTPTSTAPSSPPASSSPGTGVPTGVSAGQGTHGIPAAPLVLLVVGLLMAGAGSVAWKFRGKHVL